MKDPKHEIDDLFYNGIEGHSEYPADNVWNKIESDLDKHIVTVYKHKNKTLKRNVQILLVLLVGFVTYEATDLYDQKEPAQIQTPAKVDAQKDQANYDFNGISSTQNKITTQPDEDGLGIIADNNTSLVNGYPDKRRFEINTAGNNQEAISLFGESEPQKINESQPADIFVITSDKLIAPVNYGQYIPTETSTRSFHPNLAVNDLWKKDIPGNLSPAVFTTASSVVNMTAKENSSPRFAKSRFSISAYFSAGAALSSVREDKLGSNLSIGGGGGNNGGGNNGGGNNGGGNNGGNVANAADNHYDLKKSEYGLLAYSGGIKLSYDLGKKISLAAGLNYLSTSTRVKPRIVYAQKDDQGRIAYRMNYTSGYSILEPTGGPGLRIGDSISVSDTRNAVSYLGVPVMVEYKILSSGKFRLTGSAGAQVNILVNGTTTSVVAKGTASQATINNNNEGLKPTYFSVTTSLAGEMQLRKNLSLIVAPVGQIGLTNVNKNTSVKTRPNYLGLSTGLKLRF